MNGTPWTTAEVAELASLYPTSTAGELATRFGRSVKSVANAVHQYGLAKQERTRIGPEFLERLQALNADGHCDADIAEILSCERHTIAKWRTSLGLPSHARGERYRAKVKGKTRAQLAAAGLASLAEVRVEAFRRFASSRGWPSDVPPRAVMMLDSLAANGAMTRRQLASAIGMEWHGSRASLKSNSPRGSYLADLVSLGLVVDLGRIVRGTGKGYSVHLYSLAPTAFPEEEQLR